MEETKRKRGRPKKEGGTRKQKRICLRVDEEIYKEIKELSALEGMTQTEYLLRGVQIMNEETKSKHDYSEEYEEYDDYFDYDDYDEDNFLDE